MAWGRQIAVLGRDECAECERAVNDGLKEKPDCDACKTVRLMPENFEAVEVLELADPIMWGPGGSVNADAIYQAIDLVGVPDIRKRYTLEKIIAWIKVIREEVKKKQN